MTTSRADVAAGRVRSGELQTETPDAVTNASVVANVSLKSACCIFWCVVVVAATCTISTYNIVTSHQCDVYYARTHTYLANEVRQIETSIAGVQLPRPSAQGCVCTHSDQQPVYLAPIDLCNSTVFARKDDAIFCQTHGDEQTLSSHVLTCVDHFKILDLWDAGFCQIDGLPHLHNGNLVCQSSLLKVLIDTISKEKVNEQIHKKYYDKYQNRASYRSSVGAYGPLKALTLFRHLKAMSEAMSS